MSNSPLARSSAPPQRGKSCQYATAEPTTTAAPRVLIMLGVRPARMAPRAIGPTALRKPSRIDWGIRIMAGGKVMKAGGGWKEGNGTEPSIEQVLGPLLPEEREARPPTTHHGLQRQPLFDVRGRPLACEPVELRHVNGELGRVQLAQRVDQTHRQGSRIIHQPVRHAESESVKRHAVVLPVRRMYRGECDGVDGDAGRPAKSPTPSLG